MEQKEVIAQGINKNRGKASRRERGDLKSYSGAMVPISLKIMVLFEEQHKIYDYITILILL